MLPILRNRRLRPIETRLRRNRPIRLRRPTDRPQRPRHLVAEQALVHRDQIRPSVTGGAARRFCAVGLQFARHQLFGGLVLEREGLALVLRFVGD